MSRLFAALAASWVILAAAQEVCGETKKYNRLQHEKSPYLLQHAGNPVHWYPWGEAAFRDAVAEGKPIFLSIGYSTCHWCHVMEQESFENETVAKLLNKGFISIKVDREELPAVDQLYMSVVQAMTGRGGWPMTVVMTPERVPFFGGTYFPSDELKRLLTALSEGWEKEPEKIAATGRRVMAYLQASEPPPAGSPVLDESILKKFYRTLSARFDRVHGGFGVHRKFPPATELRALLRIARRTGDASARAMVETTLAAMARGGLHDQIGGGFHRYATDRAWRVPHFEKMLYTQALLAMVYLEAAQATGKTLYRQVASGVLDYVLENLTSPEGGFYSAEDADSEGEEGAFYVWTYEELQHTLSAGELAEAIRVYGVSREGSFETGDGRGNIFHLPDEVPWSVRDEPAVRELRARLLARRDQRPRPFKDDKVVTAWNGLMLGAFARGYQVLGDARYLDAAQRAARFIEQRLDTQGTLKRRYRLGEAAHPATLADHAYLIQGLIDLYEADFDERWINWARRLQTRQDALFRDTGGGGYFLAQPDDFLLVRNKKFTDGALPSGNGVAALNGLRLYSLTFEDAYRERAREVFMAAVGGMARLPQAHGQLLIALDFALDWSKEIAVVGRSANKDAIFSMLNQRFLPNKVLAYRPGDGETTLQILKDKYSGEGETTVYVCEDNVCKYPTDDPDKILEFVDARKTFSLNSAAGER
jgi:uncharacterized protein YyaL (SSP411 family)